VFRPEKNQNNYKDWRQIITSDFTFFIHRNLSEAAHIHAPHKSFIRLYVAVGESSWFAVSLYTEFPAKTKKTLGITEERKFYKIIKTRRVELKGAKKVVQTLKEIKSKSGEKNYN
jgi:hypothetical protein